MSEKIITVNFPAGHLIPDAEVFFRNHGCTFENCSERGIAYIKMTVPAGTTATSVEPQAMEYRQLLTFLDGTEVLEIQLRGRGSGLSYSQILRRKDPEKNTSVGKGALSHYDRSSGPRTRR